MELHNIGKATGSTHKKFRKGRGHGSGNGKTAGAGHKGQKARSGGGVRAGFEGGQNPLYRRLPKIGFYNRNVKIYNTVNLSHIDKAFNDGETVDFNSLKAKGLVSSVRHGVKILGNGEITKKLNFKLRNITRSVAGATAEGKYVKDTVSPYSASAKEKITNAGGTAEVI